MKTKILTDFQICIGVPINIGTKKNTENLSSAMFCQLGLNLIDGKKYRLGEESSVIAHTHLRTHIKSILGASLSETLNITAANLVLGLKTFN